MSEEKKYGRDYKKLSEKLALKTEVRRASKKRRHCTGQQAANNGYICRCTEMFRKQNM